MHVGLGQFVKDANIKGRPKLKHRKSPRPKLNMHNELNFKIFNEIEENLVQCLNIQAKRFCIIILN